MKKEEVYIKEIHFCKIFRKETDVIIDLEDKVLSEHRDKNKSVVEEIVLIIYNGFLRIHCKKKSMRRIILNTRKI